MARTFDPTVGTGAFLNAALLAELSMRMSDAAAERGDDAMADSFWQLGAMMSHA